MSRDIRSFFSTSASSKKTVDKKDVVVESVVSKKRKKQNFIESDSDDDVVFVDKKRGKTSETSKKPSQQKLEEVKDVSSIFGSKPAKRSSTTTSNNKEPSPKKTRTKASDTKGNHKNGKQEFLVHSDDDFIATLNELENKKTPPKQSKKIEPKAEVKDEKNPSRREKKTEVKEEKNPSRRENKVEAKEEKISPKKEKNSEKKEDTKPLHNEKTARDSKSSSKKSPEPKPKPKNDTSKAKTSDTKMNASLDEEDSALEEVWEKKKQQTDNYRKFLQRKGPAHLGEKEIPSGQDNCLAGLTFVITGVLDSLDRDGAAELIQSYGGKVTGGVSKNTSYMLTGEDAGPSKLEKAKSLKIPTIDEDGLLEMIKTRPSAQAPEPKPVKQTTPRASKHAIKTEPEPVVKKIATPPKIKTESPSSKKLVSGSQSSHVSSPGVSSQSTLPPSPVLSAGSNAMWVDKYKPQTVKHVIGQQTDRSNAKKLMQWLQEWDRNHSNPKIKRPKPAPWAKNDNGSAFKAALLSGPPGIGKTTTVQLVCKELEFDVVEFNASDTRSKKLLHEEVSEMLSTQSLSGMFTGSGKAALSKKRVLLMEEVDGMAGNNDRGGIAELILLIKKARIPVICTCNDRGSQKIRSLVNYCFDLRFQKPKLEQIRAAMMSICFKEKVTIPKDAIDAMIVGTNFDIRQIIHMMSIWAAGQTKVDTGLVEKESKKSKKEFKLGIWEITPKVFSAEMKSKNAIYDKTNLFFQDYSLTPLFVQENYLSAVHGIAGNNSMKRKLEMMSKAADSIAKGDLVDNVIRGNQAWGLLPIQAIFSTVAPGIHLRGRLCGQAMFPSWLGKNSKKNKFDRLASELQMHMRLSITGSKQAVVLDYLNPMRNLVTGPLLTKGAEGVSEAINAMVEYNLIRDDLEKLSELSTWGSATSDWQRVDSKVKAQLTRQYNKMPIMTPFAIQSISGGAKKAQVSAGADFELGDDDEEAFVESEAEEEDADKDTMIKAKKVTALKATKSESSKGKGKAPAAKKGKK